MLKAENNLNYQFIIPNFQANKNMNQKGFSSIVLTAILAAVIIVAGVGYLIAKRSVPEVMQPTPTVSVNPAPFPNQTADWKNYRNEKYGYEIKYPAGTKLSDIDVSGGREIFMQLPYFSGKTNLIDKVLHIRTVISEFNYGVEQPAFCASNAGTSNITINGIKFAKNDVSNDFSGTQGASVAIEYCAMKGNKAFKLVSQLNYDRYSQLSKFDAEKESEIFNQILSTFRFTEKDETADWKTYNSDKYDYEVKYPKDWALDEVKKESVTLNSSENEKLLKKIDNGEVYGEGYMRDITIFYYDRTTFDEFAKKELISSFTRINFAGQSAYEAIMGHFGAYYSILIEKNNHLYIIQFGNRDEKSKLTKTDDQILSTFKFTK